MPTWLAILLIVSGISCAATVLFGVVTDHYRRRRQSMRIPITRPRLSIHDREHPLHVIAGARRGPGPDIDHPAGKPRLP
jgi:hypothetical protein